MQMDEKATADKSVTEEKIVSASEAFPEAPPVKREIELKPVKKKSRWFPITVTAVISGAVVVAGSFLMAAQFLPEVKTFLEQTFLEPSEYYKQVERNNVIDIENKVGDYFPSSTDIYSLDGTYEGSLSCDGSSIDFTAAVSGSNAQINMDLNSDGDSFPIGMWKDNGRFIVNMPKISDDAIQMPVPYELSALLKKDNTDLSSAEVIALIEKYSPMFYENASNVQITRNVTGTLNKMEYECSVISVTHSDGEARNNILDIISEMRNDVIARKAADKFGEEFGTDADAIFDEAEKKAGQVPNDIVMNVYVDKYGNIIGRQFEDFFVMLIKDDDGYFDFTAVVPTDNFSIRITASGSFSSGGAIDASGTVYVNSIYYSDGISVDFILDDFRIADKQKMLLEGKVVLSSLNAEINSTLIFTVADGGQAVEASHVSLVGINGNIIGFDNVKASFKKISDNGEIVLPKGKIYNYETQYYDYLKDADYDELLKRYSENQDLFSPVL